MKTKWLLVIALTAVLVAALSLVVTAQPLTVSLNGEKLHFDDAEPLLEDGNLFVPLRCIAEALGAQVEWLDVPPTAIISRGDDVIELWPGRKKALKNSGEIALEAAPQLVNGRVLVPLRIVSEALGAKVDWHAYLNAVVIQDPLSAKYTGYTGSKLPESLPLVGSPANLKKLLRELQPFYGYNQIHREALFFEQMEAMDMGTAPGAVSGGAAQSNQASMKQMAPAPAPASEDYSRTNIQVQGVDEADIVKTDGRYIYQVNNGRIVIAKAFPSEQMEICSTIKFNDPNFTPQELYVDGNQLVVVGAAHRQIPVYKEPVIFNPDQAAAERSIPAPPLYNEPMVSDNAKMMIYPPPFYFNNTVKAIIFDISDRKNVKKVREVELEGNYTASRKIGSCLYLLANKSFDYNYIMQDVAVDGGAAINGNWDEIMAAESGDNLTPSYRDSAAGGSFTSIDYARIRYFPGFTRPNYLLIAGLNLDHPNEQVQVQTFLGAGDEIYASMQNLYVTVTGYGRPVTRIPANAPNTFVYKFALNGGKVDYSAQGQVPGTVLNQFSMDEYAGHFRLATTSTNPWSGGGGVSRNNIYILDGALNLKGKIEDIAPGEKIYAVRFMGKRGYMVTFETIDPLFVIDLENPEKPRILGALKIPGYSDYLHPYDENHLIGFGKDTMELVHKDGKGRVIGTAAIDLGMKIALFDVSDVHNPVEKCKEIIGGRGTTSELLQNHKALLFSKEKNLLAFPVTVMESKSMAGGVPDYGEFTFQGAYVYNLTLDGGFKLQGRITHLSGEDYLKAGRYWYDNNKNVERILYIGDTLYTLSKGLFKANSLGSLQEIKALAVPAN